MAKSSSEAGSALVASLAFILIFISLAVLSTGYVLEIAHHHRFERHRHDVQAYSHTALFLALEDITKNEDWRFGEGRDLDMPVPTRITFFEIAALVDLNTASPPVLEALFRHAGALEARQITAEVISRRQSTMPQSSAPDLAFTSRDDLRMVPGVSDRVFSCVRPLVTVMSRQRSPALEGAPRALRAALTPEPNRTNQASNPPAGRSIELIAGQILVAEIQIQTTTLNLFQIFVRPTGDRQNPLMIHGWDNLGHPVSCGVTNA